MRGAIAPLCATLLLAGCASSGGSSGEPTTVPVYATEAEVPCRFEVMERVEAEGAVTIPPSSGERGQLSAG